MCGSETKHASEVVGSAYANVMLVGNSLVPPSTLIPGKDLQSKPSDVPVIALLRAEVRQDHEQGNTEEALREPEEDDEEDDGNPFFILFLLLAFVLSRNPTAY